MDRSADDVAAARRAVLRSPVAGVDQPRSANGCWHSVDRTLDYVAVVIGDEQRNIVCGPRLGLDDALESSTSF